MDGWAIGIIAALLTVFALLAVTSKSNESYTYDETLHLVGGYVHHFKQDYRINPEDPPLFGALAALPLARGAITLDTRDPNYPAALTNVRTQWPFCQDMLFSWGNDATHLLGISRLAFVAVGMSLGAMIATWAWKLGGRWAAIAATVLFAFDPNFLAHSGLVKNDVMLALVLTSLCFVIWRIGIRARWYWLAAMMVLCGMALTVKFSGVLAAPILVVALVVRALYDRPWIVLGHELQTRRARLTSLLPIGLVTVLVAWGVVWAVYGFRFSATADGKPLDTALIRRLFQSNYWCATHKQQLPTDAQRDSVQLTAPMRLADDLQFYRLMPEGWVFGFRYTYVTTLLRSSFLRGKVSLIGFRWYFPLAMLFKTPIATLVAAFATAIGAVIWAIGLEYGGWRASGRRAMRGGFWAALNLGLAPVLYMGSALTTNLNLGLRHVLPIYPFIFIAVGIALAALLRYWPMYATVLGALLALGLIVESTAIYPDYLTFFNVAVGGNRGGIRLLSDSNLDWGQDLVAVAQWEKDHPDIPVYLCYFGTADPAYYGIRFIFVPDNLSEPVTFSEPGVLAISATNLQGTYSNGQLAKMLGLHHPPRDVLHGSIYLYDVPESQPDLPAAPER
jgi:dolichyl-phosphate-mannose-protein mannosyltransferase